MYRARAGYLIFMAMDMMRRGEHLLRRGILRPGYPRRQGHTAK